MLAKVPKKRRDGKSSFSSLIAYVVKPASALIHSDSVWNGETAAREMRHVSLMNERVRDPIYHYILSWPAKETPTDDQAFDAIRYSLGELKVFDHQWVGVVHRNTNNVH